MLFCKYGCKDKGRLCCWLCDQQVMTRSGDWADCKMACNKRCQALDKYEAEYIESDGQED